MRVALLSRNARCADAIGAQVAAKIAYFQQLGAEVRLYLSETTSLRPEAAAIKPVINTADRIWRDTSEREYLISCDLVVAEYGAAYDLMNLLPALTGQGPRIVVDYRGVTPVELADSGLQSDLDEAIRQRALLWCADAVLVQSQFAAEELHQSIGVLRERIHQIPCWIAHVSGEGLTSNLRTKYGLLDAKIVLFVGRLAANKQPELLIQSLAALPADVHVIFVGSQSDAYWERLELCQELAGNLNVSARVHFFGSIPETELAAWYHNADVLALPSRHECFGMPVVEAMQHGTPVVAANAGSLPEVIGHAGLTCCVDDPNELAQQIRRYLTPSLGNATRRVALVTHRFGTQFAGGAEKSLRLMASALQSHGYVVEVFTTCNEHESRWANTLPSGTRIEDGFTVHRYPIDRYDAEKLGKAYETIRRANGHVSAEVEQQYLQNSLGSQQMIEAISARRTEFAVILTGPYLFKLTYDVVKSLGDQVLLAPCFHDEPLARLLTFQKAYRQVGGLLFHTESEARYTAIQLAINHPRHTIVGTVLEESAFTGDAQRGHNRAGLNQYLVYCGRYCPEKGLDRLLQYMEHLNVQSGTTIKLVCLGQGPMKLPNRPWLVDLGFVSETVKRDAIAGAVALVNLSRNESLSIVALEAWAHCVPVIVDADCTVLVDQMNKAEGGTCVKDSVEFATTVKDWLRAPETARCRGKAGYHFVRQHYASSTKYAQRLVEAVQTLRQPLREIARKQGIQQAIRYSSDAWQQRLSAILEQVSLSPSTSAITNITIVPLQKSLNFVEGTPSGTLTLRLCNRGETVLAASGPAQASMVIKVMTRNKTTVSRNMVNLSSHLMPGQDQLLVASFELPKQRELYRVQVRLLQNKETVSRKQLKMMIVREGHHQRSHPAHSSLGPMVQSARSALSQAKRMETLPEDYVDVSEGKLANLKRSLKRKLLNNFRRAYVDVAFRQQSALNEKLIAVMSLILETVSTQDITHSVADLERRLHRVERDLKHQRRRNQQLAALLEQLSSPDVSLVEGT